MSDGISLGKARCTRSTDKAIMVWLDSEPRGARWIPQSCVHDDSEVYEAGQTGNMVVHEWWAEKEGLT